MINFFNIFGIIVSLQNKNSTLFPVTCLNNILKNQEDVLLIFEKHWNILVLPVNVSLLCM